jgi:hypothetical protein
MDSSNDRGAGWLAFSGVTLLIGGLFALIDGLVAVYQSTFFTANAQFIFSDLKTWGWIIFGLGVAGVLSGLAVFTGSQVARWTGVLVAGLGALGQLLFAQAYPVWSLMIMGVYFLAMYGLLAYGSRQSIAASLSSHDENRGEASSPDVTDLNDRSRRAA